MVKYTESIDYAKGLEGVIVNESKIGYVNGTEGQLNYRGLNIETIARAPGAQGQDIAPDTGSVMIAAGERGGNLEVSSHGTIGIEEGLMERSKRYVAIHVGIAANGNVTDR